MLKVHEEDMLTSTRERYLGDIISSDCKINENVQESYNKGQKHNSEVLYGLNNTHIEILESVDKYFWRKVFGCTTTTPTKSYIIETNSIPIRDIVMGRRLMYYWNLLQKDDSELIRKVFNTQNMMPVKNDWVLQLQKD